MFSCDCGFDCSAARYDLIYFPKTVMMSRILLMFLLSMAVGKAQAIPKEVKDLSKIQEVVNEKLDLKLKAVYDGTKSRQTSLETEFTNCKKEITTAKSACETCSSNCNRNSKKGLSTVFATVAKTVKNIGSGIKNWKELVNVLDVGENPIVKTGKKAITWTIDKAKKVGNWFKGVASKVGGHAKKAWKRIKGVASKVGGHAKKAWKGIKRLFGRRKRAVNEARNTEEIKQEREMRMAEQLNSLDIGDKNCYTLTCPVCRSFVCDDPNFIIGAVCGDELVSKNASLNEYVHALTTLKGIIDALTFVTKIAYDTKNYDFDEGYFTKPEVTFTNADGTTSTYVSTIPLTLGDQTDYAVKLSVELWSQWWKQ